MKNPKGYTTISKIPSAVRPKGPNLRLWAYLLAQFTSPPQDEVQIAKHERVYNFLQVPQKLEQVEL